jgi:hypothetical protein
MLCTYSLFFGQPAKWKRWQNRILLIEPPRRVGRLYSIVAQDRQTQNIAVPTTSSPTSDTHYIVSAELRWDLRLAITCADLGPGYRAFTL